MKYIPLILFFLAFSCKSQTKTEIKPVTIQSEDVKQIVSFLASDDLKGRDTDTKGIDKAGKFIEGKLKGYGVKPFFTSYRNSFEFDVEASGRSRDTINSTALKTKKGYNIVGYIEGNDETLKTEFIILGAHYDHIGFGKAVENDSIANGANDNAAGSSAVLSLARYFAERKTNKRSILFCLFSAEEYGLRGSRHLAEQLKSNGLNLYAMVNFEMIGVPMENKDYKAYITGFEKTNMAEKINEYTGSSVLGFLPQAKEYQLFKRSDNYPFFEKFKRPCQTISTFDFTNYAHYHGVGDEADLMDYNFMAELINDIAPAIEKMTQTTTQEIKMNDN